MHQVATDAFFDELEKISLAGAVDKLKLLKYPLAVGGGIAGWEHLKKTKRRHDIGKAYEKQMARQG